MPLILRRLAALFAIVGGLSACVVALLVVVSVGGRAALSRPIPGDVELTQFGIALCISLCLPWAQLQGSNIIVDFFTQKVPERGRHVLDAFGSLLLSVMVAVLAWRTAAGAVSVRDAFETTMILGLPMWWTYAVLAPGLALTALIALVQVGGQLTGRCFFLSRAAPKPARLPSGDRPAYPAGGGADIRRAERRAAPKPARLPSGDRPAYPAGEGLTSGGPSAGPLPSRPASPSGDRPAYPAGEGLT